MPELLYQSLFLILFPWQAITIFLDLAKLTSLHQSNFNRPLVRIDLTTLNALATMIVTNFLFLPTVALFSTSWRNERTSNTSLNQLFSIVYYLNIFQISFLINRIFQPMKELVFLFIPICISCSIWQFSLKSVRWKSFRKISYFELMSKSATLIDFHDLPKSMHNLMNQLSYADLVMKHILCPNLVVAAQPYKIVTWQPYFI